MHCCLIFALLASATKATFEPPQSVVQQFEELEYRYTGGRYDGQLFRYRLHSPREINQSKKYPILVWLHGQKERGEENRAQLRWMDLVLDKMPPDKHDFFILAAQVPSDVFSWYEANTSSALEEYDPPDDMLTVVKAILDETILSFPIDVDRAYLAGVSSGGGGCWEMAMRYPNVFAAVAPMATKGGDLSRLRRITHLPVWCFHSQVDHPEVAQQTVKTLSSLEGQAYFTVVPKDPEGLDWLQGHDCWTAAIRQFGVLGWLFNQRRGSANIPPPEKYTRTKSPGPSDLLNYAVIPGFIGVCCAVWLIEKRRRSNQKALQQPL